MRGEIALREFRRCNVPRDSGTLMNRRMSAADALGVELCVEADDMSETRFVCAGEIQRAAAAIVVRMQTTYTMAP